MHPLVNLSLCAIKRATSALTTKQHNLATAELLTATSHLLRLRNLETKPLHRLSAHDLLRLWYETTGTHEQRLIAYGNRIQAEVSGCAAPLSIRLPLSHLGLPQTAYGALRRAGYTYVDELRGLTDAQLLHIKSIGPLSVAQIRAKLQG